MIKLSRTSRQSEIIKMTTENRGAWLSNEILGHQNKQTEHISIMK